MSIQESIRVRFEQDIAVLEMDLVGEKVNKLSTPVMKRFHEALEQVKVSSAKVLVIKSLKPKIFVAGADIEEIKNLVTPEDFEKAVKGGQDIFNFLEDLPQITIASIHGACAGGGCELILACDYRIASEDSSTRIGLPETQLGIIPGFGGCVRLPRVVGLQAALDVILAGKLLNAKKAKKTGLVDKLVHPGILAEVTMSWARELAKTGAKRRKVYTPVGIVNQILEGSLGRGVVFNKAKAEVLKKTHGHYPAPLHAIEVIKKTYGQSDREAALKIEREHFCQVGVTAVSKNLIHVFYLTEMVKKQTGVSNAMIKAKEVKSVGVLGAGTMGGGIAYIGADKGLNMRIKDLNFEALGKAYKHASDLWLKLLKKKVIDKYQYKQKLDLVSGGLDYAGFKTLDVAIEAIVEDMNIKKKVIGETAKNMRADAIIATNTSSLSVTEMAEGHPRPEFFVGMHFFNPVDKMPLVEVIKGPKTSEETVVTIFELSKKMGKMPVVVKDGPGFLVNRLLIPYLNEAVFLFQEGMDIKTLDDYYVKTFGMPMGPLALMDEVGLDVGIKVVKIFKKAFGDRIEIPEVMEKIEKTGRLGKKNGKGFYQYTSDGKRLEADPGIYAELGMKSPTNPYGEKECLERGIFSMINECTEALNEDRIVETPHEVDLAMIMGTGFPPFRGGLCKYSDSIGSLNIANALEEYAVQRKAKRLKPLKALDQMAKTQRSFYY
ncbi:MAG: 3-hydroxyacyl-CoA dehydrogenase NAD-binding domain-containing protein [Bdellovibrionaceae bacterium]|nr:3-hydroxyacyl-CoA dehydrogenase NAD-binding domain-containing protein [Pseudobdellovibrionaceae bacterium]NUM57979.1 enoyl-CoA hydratase/isomerase family protein [Pseudobdellovibrionaceae bacterium]